MSERPCRELEEKVAEAWKAVEAVPRLLDDLPLVTEPLGIEDPEKAIQVNPEWVKRKQIYRDLAKKLRECYERHKIPLKEQLWPRSKSP